MEIIYIIVLFFLGIFSGAFCIGGFKKIPKNINSMPIDRSYRVFYDEIKQKYNNIKIKEVSSISTNCFLLKLVNI